MDLEEMARNDWIRAATVAHTLLSQSLGDEQLEQLVASTPAQPVPTLRAA